jgi:hypothetical protein
MKDHYTITSTEAKRLLKLSDCKLMHVREQGIIRAVKKGRSFLYNVNDIEKYNTLKQQG